MKNWILVLSLHCYLGVSNAYAAPLDAGQFFLSSKTTFPNFKNKLNDFKNFMQVYLDQSSESGLEICQGWSDFAKINSQSADLCTTTNKLGYDVVVLSRFDLKAITNSLGDSCMQYKLTILPGTRPELLINNVASLTTDFCLAKDGRTVNYATEIEAGRKKGFLYPMIAIEFKKLIPNLVNAVRSVSN